MSTRRILLALGFAALLGSPPLAAIVDRNADGLSDVWAALYHPTKGAGVDEDGDGLTNAQESLAGTDPLNAASRFAAVPPQTDAAGNLVLRWRGAWGKRYTVQSSTDLKTWTALPDLHIGRGEELSTSVRAAGAIGEARRYWRVVVADVDTDGDGMTNAEEIELGSAPTTADAAKGTPRVYGAEYFVSTIGNDANAGTKVAPFRTLEKAQAAVRVKIAAGVPAGGIAVWLRGGIYERSATLALVAEDSGTSAANSVDWRGWPAEEVRLIGGKKLDAAGFTLVTSASPIWNRLDASAKGKVVQLDLKPILGITTASTAAQKLAAYGQQKPSADYWFDRHWNTGLDAALELFVDREPMQLGRWPDVGANDPVQGIKDDAVEVYGPAVPAVAGHYTKSSVVDGVSFFKRDGLVDYAVADASGTVVTEHLQYYLRRYTYDYLGDHYVAWFVTTSTAGHPSTKAPVMRPWWALYRSDGLFGDLAPYSPSGAGGTLCLDNPTSIRNGFARVATAASEAATESRFAYYGDRPSRWSQARDPWVHGYLQYLYFDRHHAATFDTASKTVTLGTPSYVGIKAGRPWYAYNLLEEITLPGEWYLDRESGILYLWPPAEFSSRSEVVISMLETPLFALNKASHIALRDFTAEGTRKSLISIEGGDGATVSRLLLRNTGGTAVAIGAGPDPAKPDVSGTNHLVSRCTIQNTGLKGVYMTGGDRPSLTESNLRVEDCEISRFGRVSFCYQPAVQFSGCGQIVRNNLLRDSHHTAILWGGNEHLIELNEISQVCQTSSDAGVIYAGYDWGARGTAIRHNYLHDIYSVLGRWVHGIYLDDCLSGVTVEGNIVTDLVGHGIMAGGGRDHLMTNNIFVRCGRGLYGDARGVTWNLPTSPNKGDWSELLERLTPMGHQKEPWASRYPKCAAIPNDWATVLSDKDWLRPKGCVFSHNLGWRNDRWTEGEVESEVKDANGKVIQTIRALERYAEIADNVADQDPLFVDEANGDLNLKLESPAHAIRDWKDIPFDRIGVRE